MRIEEEMAAQLKYYADTITAWAKARKTLEPIVEQLEKLDINPTWWGSYLQVNFSGNKDKLVQVIRIVRAAGLKNREAPTESKTGFQCWYKPTDDPRAEFSLYLNFTSSVCVRVKVGTEMKEVDIFEVKCGDDLPEVDAPESGEAAAIYVPTDGPVITEEKFVAEQQDDDIPF